MNPTDRARLMLEMAAGLDDELQGQLAALLEPVADPDGETTATPAGAGPTLAEYVPVVRRAQAGTDSETVRTYSSYWRVLTHGIRGSWRPARTSRPARCPRPGARGVSTPPRSC